MTEEEAKTKWCPHVKIIKFENTLYNSRGEYWTGGLPNLCIASYCMMWVPEDKYSIDTVGNLPNREKSETEGHCGLINTT